jgi:hypothetical protein
MSGKYFALRWAAAIRPVKSPAAGAITRLRVYNARWPVAPPFVFAIRQIEALTATLKSQALKCEEDAVFKEMAQS